MADRRRLWRRWVAGVAISAATLACVGFGCVDTFVLHPTRDTIDAGRAKRILIDGPNGAIEAWVARSFDDNAPPDGFVLAFVGNEQRAERLAEYNADRWRPRRVETWTINHPGYGGTDGPARLRSIALNALAAYDALAKVADGRPIFVTSNSIGGTAALHVAARRQVAGMVVQNPPALRQVIRGQGWRNLWLLAYPASLRVPAELDAPANAKTVSAPAVFITAEPDNRVMPKFQQLTIDAFAGPKRVLHLKHKGHDDMIDSPGEWAEFRADVDWLWPR